jgi:hypothetical protein
MGRVNSPGMITGEARLGKKKVPMYFN